MVIDDGLGSFSSNLSTKVFTMEMVGSTIENLLKIFANLNKRGV